MPIRDYLKFIAANLRFVTFGFFLAFASSFGQTFFIGTFGPAIQMEFSLSHTSWGTIYMVGTLGSAALLPWTGKQIDRFDLRPYTALVCILLTIACGFTAFVTTGVMLVFAIFLLRQSGQGLMSHVAITSMTRYFDRDRGRAVAIATLGFSTGEAFLPFLAVIAISVCGWRWAYGGIAILLAVGLIPCVFWLLRDYDKRHQAYLARISAPATPGGQFHRSWTRTEVLKDIRFYLLLPGILAPSLIVTAMFFHHLNLADAKNWSHAWITGSYVIYAAAAILTALASGPLIDRFGASRQVSIMLMPLTVAMIVIAEFSNQWIAWPYLHLNRHQCRRRPYSRIGYVGGDLWRRPSWGDQKPGSSAQCLCLGFGSCDRGGVDGLGSPDRTSLSAFFRLRGLRGSPYYHCAYAP